jgi:hypothetical protein
LIEKIYEVDPLAYPKYSGKMKVISSIPQFPVSDKWLYIGPEYPGVYTEGHLA